LLTTTLTGVALAGCSVFGFSGVEEPEFNAQLTDGAFEVREYPELVVAATTVVGPRDDAEREAFRRLFRYISGGNLRQSDIPMTAPVIIQPQSQQLDAPPPVVLQQESSGSLTMAFILPSSFTAATAPTPLDQRVIISAFPKRRVATVRFSGWWTEPNQEQHRHELMEWLSVRNISYKPETFRVAGYDPPWTLPFLRRNEVHVDLNSE
jgi:DNA gyrase inhibitor GyrI